MPSIGNIVEQLTDTVAAVTVLQRARAINLLKPGRTVAIARETKTIGPMSSVIGHNANDFPGLPALTDERGTLTWKQLDDQANALANALIGYGLGPGSVIGIVARDHRAIPLALAAAGRAGIRLAMMNTGFGVAQFRDVAEREKLAAILYDEEFAALAASLDPAIPRILTWRDSATAPGRPAAPSRSGTETPGHSGTDTPGTPASTDFALPAGTRTLDDIAETGDTTRPAEPEKWGGMVILTSGTTGLPKGARREQFSPFASAIVLDRIPLPRHAAMVIVSPIFHSTGFALWAVGAALANEAVFLRRFDPEKTLAALAEHRAEVLVAVPTMAHRILALGPETIGKYDLSALKTVVIAGSALPPALSQAFQQQFGEVLYNLYGSTEVGVVSVAQPRELRRAPSSIGRPSVTVHLALFDDAGRRITEPITRGRLFARTGAPFEGYTDGRDKDFLDGYMSTGDMAYFDDSGLWFIAGRDDDMIVSGGENVYPQEVENLLAAHPEVDDVAVIGVDDEEYGTRLRAFVVAADDARPDPDDLRAHVKANLARYKVPRDVVFVDELPRNPTGKLVRRLLPTGPLD